MANKKKKQKKDLWKKAPVKLGLATKESITDIVLETILHLAYSTSAIFARRSAVYKNVFSLREQLNTESKICKAINSLKQRGLIEIRHGSHGESFAFTKKATIKMLAKISERISAGERFHLLSFDIPEKFRYQRDQFRNCIKRLGFKQIQKSLWVINRDVPEFVQLLLDEYKLNEYVVSVFAANTDIDDHIKGLFIQEKQV
ncbi:MAG TPA: hypothetical protein PK263_03450 [bacterium]|nr:hypothetical protein [bacterium]